MKEASNDALSHSQSKSELLERTAVEGKDASFKGAPRRTLVWDPEATCASPPCEDLGLARVV